MTESIDFYNLEQITGEDKAYRQELVMLYLELLKKLPLHYEECMHAKDVTKLAAVIHKAKPSLVLLGLENCFAALKEGQALISTENVAEKAIKTSVEGLKMLCQTYVQEFIQYQNRC